ncbi:MAG: peptidoglycan editing factor PgeF [Oscillospiraceae bacterium]|jgi:YfiH family protein|nr:peptidoglycan editing factor PgeF [Oscillospiraceae bacterium]
MIFKSANTNLNIKEATAFVTFPILEAYKSLRHGFSTRLGGVSKNEFKSMNFRFFGNETRDNILENYCRFSRAIGVEFKDLISVHQVHGDQIQVIEDKDRGTASAIYRQERPIYDADGLVTAHSDLALVTYHADCTPIFFFDPIKKVIGLVHSGFKGTAKGIAFKMINKMCAEFSCKEQDIICVIGPAISQDCYEVDDVVYEEFKEMPWVINSSFIKSKKGQTKGNENKYMLCLKTANKEILKRAGVKSSNIYMSDLCTYKCSDMFFSHRAMGDNRGVMIAVMCMKF